MKAIIYARQSSGDEEQSASIEVQIDSCKKLCKAQNLEIINVYSDNNISGKTYPAGGESIADVDNVFNDWFSSLSDGRLNKKYRTGLGNCLEALNNADYLILDDTTRLMRPISRSYLESYIIQKITESNIKILTVKNGAVDLLNFNDYLINNLNNHINDNQIAIQRKKCKSALKNLKDSGYLATGANMYGYESAGHQKVRILDNEASIVKYIFKSVIDRIPYNQIVTFINDNMNPANLISYRRLQAIICRPCYAGYQYNSNQELIKSIPFKGLELVSLSDWQEANKIVAVKKRKPPKAKKRHLPLSGLLKCGYCGKNMVVYTGESFSNSIDKGERVVYYKCSAGYLSKNKDNVCRTSSIRYNLNKADSVGLKQVITPFLMPELLRQAQGIIDSLNNNNEADELKAELMNITTKQKEIVNLLTQNLIPADIVESQLKELKEKQTTIQSKLDVLAGSDSKDKLMKKLIEINRLYEKLMTDDLTDKLYEKLVHEAIKEILIYSDKIAVSFNHFSKVIELPRIPQRSTRNFPKWTLHASPLIYDDKSDKMEININGAIEIYYYHHKVFKAKKDDIIIDEHIDSIGNISIYLKRLKKE